MVEMNGSCPTSKSLTKRFHVVLIGSIFNDFCQQTVGQLKGVLYIKKSYVFQVTKCALSANYWRHSAAVRDREMLRAAVKVGLQIYFHGAAVAVLITAIQLQVMAGIADLFAMQQ
jgi:hypothetical protein